MGSVQEWPSVKSSGCGSAREKRRGYDPPPDLEEAQERYFEEHVEPLNFNKKVFQGYVEAIQERNLKEHVEL